MKLTNSLTLSKCEIIDSMMKEPFICGTWISSHARTLEGANQENASVCAIGGMLREHVDPRISPQDFSIICSESRLFGDSHVNLKPGMVEYFDQNIFSQGDNTTAAMRYRVVQYIDRHFPDTVTFKHDRAVFIDRG